MSRSAAASSKKKQPLPLDPALQNTLVAKFGATLMKQGFTALPVLVQKYYRYVPGNSFPHKVVNAETGEVLIVERISSMTPTEYTLMTTIWSYWWDHQNNPWPSVAHLCAHMNKSERQVRRYLQRLREKGFMLSLAQFASDGKQISNRYDFTPFLKRLVATIDAREAGEKRVQPPRGDDTFDRESMSDEAGTGCQNRQAIEDEADSNLSDEENSDSSGSAATQREDGVGGSMGTSHPVALGTIRRAKEETNETEETNAIEANRTANPCVPNEERAGAQAAKEAESALESKKLTPFERTALQAGVPIEFVEEMHGWYQACPRPEKHPMFLEGIISTFSQQLDNITSLPSNLTQATKLFRYAQLKGFSDDDFRVWLYDAEKRARREGITNKMAYFFTALKIELLGALVGSQWPPHSAEPDRQVVEETVIPAAEMANDQQGVETTGEEPWQAQQEIPRAHREQVAASRHSEREAKPERALMIYCEDPTAGWNSYENAAWWADRLRDHLGKDQYRYTICPTEHGKWAFIFFANQDPDAGEIILTGATVSYYMHHRWHPPVQGQS